MRAVAACEHGHFAEAEQLCAAILGAQPDHFAALHILAMAQSRLGRMDEALANCTKALAVRPGDAATLHLRGAI